MYSVPPTKPAESKPALGILAGLASVLVFFLTQSLTGSMLLADLWTILMAALLAAQIALALWLRHTNRLNAAQP